MVSDIIKAISNKLYTEFGHEVYIDKVPREVDKDGFCIKCLSSKIKAQLPPRYFERNLFDIFSIVESQEEAYSLIEKLFDDLEYVRMLNGDLIRGTDMHAEIEDGVLHFFVNYNLFLIKKYDIIDSEKMEFLEALINPKDKI